MNKLLRILKRNNFILIIGCLNLMIITNSTAQNDGIRNLINPSAEYCISMGYEYKVIKDSLGNETGVCVLPNKKEYNAWDFYKGKVAQKYSYCAKKGYSIITEKNKTNGYIKECAICVPKNKNNTSDENINMIDLMKKNGDFEIKNSLYKNLGDDHNSQDFSPIKHHRNKGAYPKSFDLRDIDGRTYIGPVRNQGYCGSCYSFAACANAESTYNIYTNNYNDLCINFSESFIIWCLSMQDNNSNNFYGCDGSDYDFGELEAITKYGLITEDKYPYSETAPLECSHMEETAIPFKEWNRVDCSDIEGIKKTIIENGAAIAAVLVNSKFEDYSSGIFDDEMLCEGSPCSYSVTNHLISLVGWGNDNTYGDYWILRNSWGSNWGEDGYMRITTRSSKVSCGVAYLEYKNNKPIVLSDSVSSITKDSAVIHAIINANNDSTTYYFSYGKTSSLDSSTSVIYLANDSTDRNVSYQLSGLDSLSMYYYRITAENIHGKYISKVMAFNTEGKSKPPVVNIIPSSSISYNKATINGSVITGNYFTNVMIVYDTIPIIDSIQFLCNKAVLEDIIGIDTVNISKTIYWLDKQTTYYYKLIAISGNDTVLSSDSFTTIDDIRPIIIADSIINITKDSVSIFVKINPNNDSAFYYVKYGKSEYYLDSLTKSTYLGDSISTDVFVNLTNLDSLTKYYYRVVAENNTGKSYSDIKSFITDGVSKQPTVRLLSPSNISYNQAKINGKVNLGGLSTNVYFEYGTDSSYGSTGVIYDSPFLGVKEVEVSSDLFQLIGSTEYHYRLVAISGNDTIYSVDSILTTSIDYRPIICCDSVSNITKDSAIIYATVNPNADSTTYYFMYGESSSNCLLNSTPKVGLSGDTTNTIISTQLFGLDSLTKYDYMVVATNNYGISYSKTKSFISGGNANSPSISILSPTDIFFNRAKINISANSGGLSTDVFIEYGINQNYTDTVVFSKSPIDGLDDNLMYLILGDLQHNTEYHYRVVAVTSIDTTYTDDSIFITKDTSDYCFVEGIENDNKTPIGWTQEYIAGNNDWIFVDLGNEKFSNYCAKYIYYDYDDIITKLISPVFDFGIDNSANLIFNIKNLEYYGDQDVLKVYYKNSIGGNWNLLKTYDTNIDAFVLDTIELLELSSTYYIAFEGKSNYGDGIFIDDIMIECNTGTNNNSTDFSNNKLILYPNPARNKVSVVFPKDISANPLIKLYNIEGKRIDIDNIELFENKVILNLGEINTGVYYMQIVNCSDVYNEMLLIE